MSAQAVERSESELRRELARRYELSGLDEGHRLMTFDRYRPETPSQRQALRLARGKDYVWLTGEPGVGKTHLLAARAIQEMRVGGGVRYVFLPAEMGWLRAASRSCAEDRIHELEKARFLSLDDVGVRLTETDYGIEVLLRIVDTRLRCSRPLFVASNAAPEELRPTIGGRLASRLMGGLEHLRVEGPDWRMTR